MIRAILWKEYREQGLIALTLLVVGGGLLAAAAAFADPPSGATRAVDILQYLGLGRLATLMLAVTAGIVTGGALFAAERESGTLRFLESQPGMRFQLWRAKVVAGALLTLPQVLGVLVISAALGLVTEPSWMRSIAAEAFLAFAWGAFGSTFARTTLGSVGFAIPFAALLAIGYAIPIMILFASAGGLVRGWGQLLYFLLMMVSPLVASAVAFSRVDRVRADQARAPQELPLAIVGRTRDAGPRMARSGRAAWPALSLAWLVTRQMAIPTVVLSLFASLFGLSLLLPGIQTVFYWPLLALSAGVMAGVLTFAAEQSRGEYRFWAETRLPWRGLWLTKIVFHLLLLAWLLLLLMLPSVVRAQFVSASSAQRARTFLGTVFHARLFDQLQGAAWLYLLLPAVYGFVTGHLTSLLFRKPVVAAGVAGLLGGTLALFWVPSLLAGGVAAWQVWSPVVLLLLLGGGLIRPWITERLLQPRALGTMGMGGAAAFLLLAAGLLHRAYEVPEAADLDADQRYLASLPPLLERTTGREFQAVVAAFMRVHEIAGGKDSLKPAPAIPPAEELTARPRGTPRDLEALETVLLQGWPASAEPAPLDGLLDRDFTDSDRARETWYGEAVRAAKAMPGAFWDPRQMTTRNGIQSLQEARVMTLCLLARGLQQQARGEADRFAEKLQIVLALVRSMRTGSVVASFQMALRLERLATLATNRWLERLSSQPDLLRVVLDEWLAHDAAALEDPRICYLAERYVLREAQGSPTTWLGESLKFPSQELEAVDSMVELVSTAWSVPWERERTRRLLGVPFDNGRGQAVSLVRGRPGANLFYPRRVGQEQLLELERRRQAARRLLILRIALMLHETAGGQPAESLDELLRSGRLRELPRDPWGEGTFRYRLSTGESLVLFSMRTSSDGNASWPGTDDGPTIMVPAGRGILWSVGPGRTNAAGARLLAPADPVRLFEESFLDLVPRAESK